ncbi:hypothetical protein L0660_05755 [Dyadobacter sp. CY351]|nr:hypothetical protein [Dyadobacter sp. CY351]
MNLACEIFITEAPALQSIVKIYSHRKREVVYNYWQQNSDLLQFVKDLDINTAECLLHIPAWHPAYEEFAKENFCTVHYQNSEQYINSLI